MWSSSSGKVPHNSGNQIPRTVSGWWRRIIFNWEKEVSGFTVYWVDLFWVRHASLCTCPVLTVRPTLFPPHILPSSLWPWHGEWICALCVRGTDCHAEVTSSYPLWHQSNSCEHFLRLNLIKRSFEPRIPIQPSVVSWPCGFCGFLTAGSWISVILFSWIDQW